MYSLFWALINWYYWIQKKKYFATHRGTSLSNPLYHVFIWNKYCCFMTWQCILRNKVMNTVQCGQGSRSNRASTWQHCVDSCLASAWPYFVFRQQWPLQQVLDTKQAWRSYARQVQPQHTTCQHGWNGWEWFRYVMLKTIIVL